MMRWNSAVCGLLLALNGYAQDANNLAVDGTLKDESGERVIGASVSLFQDGALINKVTTGKNGRFDLFLDYNHEFIVEVSKPGYVTKKLYFNTKGIPTEEQLWAYEYGGFNIDMLKRIPDIDYSILDKPIGKVYFDPNAGAFVDDRLYTKTIRTQLEVLEQEYLAKIKNAQMQAASLEADYALALRDAEAAMTDGDLLTAKENYLAAANLKPDETLPEAKLAEIDQKLKALGESETRYQSLLTDADALFATANYSAAITKFKEASALKPTEAYPKQRVAESEKLIKQAALKAEADAAAAAADKKYDAEVAKADQAFFASDYQNAKIFYQNALGMKPDKTYPKEQIALADTKLKEAAAAQKNAEALALAKSKYDAAIDRGDAAFNTANYANAKAAYEEAKGHIPTEAYPTDQLAKIEQLLADQLAAEERASAQRELDEKVRLTLAKGNKSLAARDYDAALAAFDEVLALQPNNAEAQSQKRVAEAARLVAEQEKQRLAAEAQAGAAFENAMSKGIAAMQQKNWDAAEAAFNEAKSIRPSDKAPQEKLAELVALREAEARNAKKAADDAAREALFRDKVAAADAAFNAKTYGSARVLYEEALEMKPTDAYVKSQLAKALAAERDEAAQKSAEQLAAAKRAEFDVAMTSGEASLTAKKLSEAKAHFERALLVIPKEPSAVSKLTEVNKLLEQEAQSAKNAEQNARQKADYDGHLVAADKAFVNTNYEEAITSYNLAAAIFPNEEYPKQRINEANARLDQERLAALEDDERKRQEAAQKAYETAITQADKQRNANAWTAAIEGYTAALNHKPNDEYAAGELAAAKRKLEELQLNETSKAEKERQLTQLFATVQQKHSAKNWAGARDALNDAEQLNPSDARIETWRKQIADGEANELAAAESALYAKLVAEADQAFIDQNWEVAKSKYESILQFKPNDGHSAERLKRVFEKQNAAATKTETSAKSDIERVITETVEKDARSVTTIRTVTYGNTTDVYKRVIYSWGGRYFFLNDQPINEMIWNKDTTK